MKKQIKTGIYLIVLILLVIFVAGIFSRKNDTESIKVGVILPLSGQYAAIGETDRNSMLMAKNDFKASNIELYFEDDKYDARTAVTAYQKLRSINNVDVVVVLSAPSIKAIKPLTDKDGIPLLALGATLVNEVDSVFQLMPSGDMLFVTLGQITGDKYKNIVVAHSNAELFTLNSRGFIKGLARDVSYTDVTIAPSSDYRTEVEKIIQKKPDAVTAFMPKEEALKFLKSLKIQDQSGKIKIVCDFGTELAVDEYVAVLGRERLEGCVSTNIADTANLSFKEKYKNTYNVEPVITADYAYDSIGLVKMLSDSTKKSNWIELLAGSDFSYNGHASGEIRFNQDGTRLDVPPKVNVFKNGKFTEVK